MQTHIKETLHLKCLNFFMHFALITFHRTKMVTQIHRASSWKPMTLKAGQGNLSFLPLSQTKKSLSFLFFFTLNHMECLKKILFRGGCHIYMFFQLFKTRGQKLVFTFILVCSYQNLYFKFLLQHSFICNRIAYLVSIYIYFCYY